MRLFWKATGRGFAGYIPSSSGSVSVCSQEKGERFVWATGWACLEQTGAFMLHHIRASLKFLGGKNEPEGIPCWMTQLSHVELIDHEFQSSN